jgi:hypothetical protein
VERRGEVQERRQRQNVQLPAERRIKPRRKLRKLQGSPPGEAIVIDVADDDVVRYWAAELDLTADELKSLVQITGPSIKAVRERLRK